VPIFTLDGQRLWSRSPAAKVRWLQDTYNMCASYFKLSMNDY